MLILRLLKVAIQMDFSQLVYLTKKSKKMILRDSIALFIYYQKASIKSQHQKKSLLLFDWYYQFIHCKIILLKEMKYCFAFV